VKNKQAATSQGRRPTSHNQKWNLY